MQMESHVKERIVRNAALSLVLYALPVALMCATFAFTGAHPWEHTHSS